ncbi:hypothetical protein KKH03_00570 [Patescibacteria group bacterium]|nr:hypothetical protein [Patescibacteria group bacterium]
MFNEKEPPVGSPEDDKKKPEEKGKEQKDTVFYKGFDESAHKKVLNGIKVNAGEEKKERAKTLAGLDEQLRDASGNKPEKERDSKKQEALKQRFAEISPMLKPGKMWIKAEVSGEVHNISFSSLEVKGKEEKPRDVSEKLEKEEIKLNEVSVNFALKNTEGRPESLNLNFKTSLTAMLEGGGNIEDKLQTLVTRQFAGTEHHYKTLAAEAAEKSEQINPAPEQVTDFEKGKQEIMDSLQKAGAEISQMEGGGLYSIIAKMPDSEEQIHVSAINGRETWNVAVTEKDQKNTREKANLMPQEIISQYIEQTK